MAVGCLPTWLKRVHDTKTRKCCVRAGEAESVSAEMTARNFGRPDGDATLKKVLDSIARLGSDFLQSPTRGAEKERRGHARVQTIGGVRLVVADAVNRQSSTGAGSV